MADNTEEMCESEESSLESIIQRHKKEIKDLQKKIQALKHSVPKGDKKKKKEIAIEIAKLEAEQDERHEKEIKEVNLKEEPPVLDTTSSLSERLEATSISDEPLEGKGPEEKVSRAQKRRAKKAVKEHERDQRVADAELENVNSARNVEARKLKELLASRKLGMIEIPPDGHCLYNAVADQMQRRNAEIEMLTLRQQTADYMMTHQDDFLPFLDHPDSGEMYTPDQFAKYCEDVATTSVWGGQLELRALSHVLHMPIEVLQANAPPITIGEEFKSQPVILSYHHHAYGLGEHYNSVIPAAPSDDADNTS